MQYTHSSVCAHAHIHTLTHTSLLNNAQGWLFNGHSLNCSQGVCWEVDYIKTKSVCLFLCESLALPCCIKCMYNGWALFWTAQAQIGTNKPDAKCTVQETACQSSNRSIFCFVRTFLGVFLYSACICLVLTKRGSRENFLQTERRWTHLIVCGALGLGDELGIADVTIALCEQASIHDARRLHLHLRLHKHTHTQTYANMNMIKMQNGIKCQWTLQCVLEMHEHACVSSQFRNSFP